MVFEVTVRNVYDELTGKYGFHEGSFCPTNSEELRNKVVEMVNARAGQPLLTPQDSYCNNPYRAISSNGSYAQIEAIIDELAKEKVMLVVEYDQLDWMTRRPL